jgi:hypothetical protein
MSSLEMKSNYIESPSSIVFTLKIYKKKENTSVNPFRAGCTSTHVTPTTGPILSACSKEGQYIYYCFQLKLS